MIHKDKDKFSKLVDRVASQAGFYAPLMEKDYYLTILLSRINKLSEKLIFKGGTCLNKIYYTYYRLSEDLDFSLLLPNRATTRGSRRKAIQPVKDNIESFAKQLGMRVEGIENAGRNESKQYIYYFIYDSVMLPIQQTVKFEIGLRFNPIEQAETQAVQHKFIHAFTGKPVFDGGRVNCLSLDEIVSEKLRAAALRPKVAPRDFYDIDFIIRKGFNIASKNVMALFKEKIKEDNGDATLSKYKVNLGRSDDEIKNMRSRIEDELFGVLMVDERKNFDLDKAFKRINKMMKKVK